MCRCSLFIISNQKALLFERRSMISNQKRDSIYATHSRITDHTRNHSSPILSSPRPPNRRKKTTAVARSLSLLSVMITSGLSIVIQRNHFRSLFFPRLKTDGSRTRVFLNIQRGIRREDGCSHVGSNKNSISLRYDVRWNGPSGWCHTLLCLVYWDQDH